MSRTRLSDRIATDLRLRVQRLMRGERRNGDVDRLFLALREHGDRSRSVREIGDFVAHRDKRDRGAVLEQAADVLTSITSFVRVRREMMGGKAPDIEAIRRVAEANLRLATREQLVRRLRMTRPEAKGALKRAFAKLDRDEPVSRSERRAVDWLGGAFVWSPEFTDASLFDDLVEALVWHGVLTKSEVPAFAAAKPFVCLSVVVLMHGSALKLPDGSMVELLAGFDNDEGNVEVKARLAFIEAGKSISVPLCLYWTLLSATEHCDQALLEGPREWGGPLDVVGEKLVPMT